MSDDADRPREGDKVRATYVYEGTFGVDRLSGPYVKHGEGPYDRVYLDLTAGNIEILERAMPKVGDVVKGSELARLPEESVVVGDTSGRAWQKRGDYWFSADAHHDRMSLPHGGSGVHRVLYVPEQ